MNDIWVIHEERIMDKKQIQKGLQIKSLKQPQFQYYERERQRQKKENLLVTQLKKFNKNFNHNELKKQHFLFIQVRTFLSTVVNIMNSYLYGDGRVVINTQKFIICNQNTEESQQNSKIEDQYRSISPQLYSILSQNQKSNSQLSHYKPTNNNNEEKSTIINHEEKQNISIYNEDDFSNFYQTYINLFVNFFNVKSQQKPMLVKLDNIRSIIRPNNQFIIVDLLKALLQCCRHEFRLLLKQFLNDQTIKQNYLIKKNVQVLKIDLNHIQEAQEGQNTIDLHGQQQHIGRKVQTQPEVYTPDFNVQLRPDMIKLSPNKHSHNNTKSIVNLLKKNSTQILRAKTEDTIQVMKSRFLHAHFIDTSIKNTVYQKNYEFIAQLNLQKLQNKANIIYIQLSRLNTCNGQMITNFYQQSLGKRNKFNYDQRGLYSESQIVAKRQHLSRQIMEFQKKQLPCKRPTSVELKEHVNQFTKHKQKCQELRALSKSIKVSKPISKWLPLRFQLSNSIIQPLRLQIEESNPSTKQIITYHWRKYHKPFSIIDFLKQTLKAQYDKTLLNTFTIGSNLEIQIFRKKKFKKQLFVDNRKKINQLLSSNNIISTSKRENMFPVIKKVQQSYIKNSSNNINTIIHQNSYALENSIQKNKDLRSDFIQRKIQNLSSKQGFNNCSKSKEKDKEFDSMKNIPLRQNSQRKCSESEKLFNRLSEHERERSDFLCKLSTKRETPISLTNRDMEQQKIQKYEKKSLISMSKILNLKPEENKEKIISKSIQVSMMTGKKLPVLNLLS